MGRLLFFYDTRDRLIAMREVPSTGTGHSELYYWVDNEMVFRSVLSPTNTETERAFVYNDHLATPRVAVAVNASMASPTTIYRAPREPFMDGVPQQSSGVAPVQQRFPGQWSDPGTGFYLSSGALVDPGMPDLVNNQARQYDSGLGGYTGVEPLIIAGFGGQFVSVQGVD